VKVLGLIPARGGSRAVPRKNLARLGGAPLIAHTIRAGLGARTLDRVLVTTDDPAIAAAARRRGAEVLRRPAALAGHRTPMVPVVRHALDALARAGYAPDAVAVLQPTSPFRGPGHIDAAVRLLERSGAWSVLSAHPVSEHPCECVAEGPGGLRLAATPPRRAWGRQSFPEFYYVNGGIYVVRREDFLRKKRLWDRLSRLYIMDPLAGLEIDEPHHLVLARALALSGAPR
jgi:CMP-N-acetylneuraminic acid synthetase